MRRAEGAKAAGVGAITVAVLACGGTGVTPPIRIALLEVVEPRRDAPAASPPRLLPLEGEDFLAEVVRWNSAMYAPPPSAFRTGSNDPAEQPLPAAVVDRSRNGYRVWLGGSPIPTPTYHKGAIIVSSGLSGREVLSIEAKTGRVSWQRELADNGASTVACEGGLCALTTESCTLYSMKADTGEPVWSHIIGPSVNSSPAIGGGLVFVGFPPYGEGDDSPEHVALAAFDLATGELRWSRWIDDDVVSAPVFVDGTLYATTWSGALYAFDASTGAILAARKARATSAPIVAGGRLFYSKRADEPAPLPDGRWREAIVRVRSDAAQPSESLGEKRANYSAPFGFGPPVAIDPPTALQMPPDEDPLAPSRTAPSPTPPIGPEWDPDLVGPNHWGFEGSRVLAMGDEIIAVMGDEIVGAPRRGGGVSWRTSLAGNRFLGGARGSPPIAAGTSVLVSTYAGDIVRIDPTSGAIQATYAAGAELSGQPIAIDGWIYVGTWTGELVAIDTGDPTLTGWSTWGGDARRSGVASR
ncbi:MAG: PQQ-binding-like beta-propeller repeat protein [Polyangiaceae bacterium]